MGLFDNSRLFLNLNFNGETSALIRKTSMEAQGLMSGFLPNPKAPVFENPQNLCLYQHNILKPPHFGSGSKLVTQRVGVKSVNTSGIDRLENVAATLGVDSVKRKRLAVFVSGGGSNFKFIHQACVGGGVYGDVALVVTNKPECGGAEYAREKGIPLISLPKTSSLPNGLCPQDLVTSLRKFEVDFIILAGYLKLLPVELVRAYPRSIVNIHPSLLPAFGGKGYYGMKVHKAVIASGARYSGPTVHFVDEHYDTGRILAQSVVSVLASDTAEELAARVLSEEHRLYVEVTSALCEDRIVWREDGVPLIKSKENPKQYY